MCHCLVKLDVVTVPVYARFRCLSFIINTNHNNDDYNLDDVLSDDVCRTTLHPARAAQAQCRKCPPSATQVAEVTKCSCRPLPLGQQKRGRSSTEIGRSEPTLPSPSFLPFLLFFVFVLFLFCSFLINFIFLLVFVFKIVL